MNKKKKREKTIDGERKEAGERGKKRKRQKEVRIIKIEKKEEKKRKQGIRRRKKSKRERKTKKNKKQGKEKKRNKKERWWRARKERGRRKEANERKQKKGRKRKRERGKEREGKTQGWNKEKDKKRNWIKRGRRKKEKEKGRGKGRREGRNRPTVLPNRPTIPLTSTPGSGSSQLPAFVTAAATGQHLFRFPARMLLRPALLTSLCTQPNEPSSHKRPPNLGSLGAPGSVATLAYLSPPLCNAPESAAMELCSIWNAPPPSRHLAEETRVLWPPLVPAWVASCFCLGT